MLFFWGYHPDYWKGLRRHKFLDAGTGLRFIQTPFAKSEETLFNSVMSRNSPLRELIKENNCWMMVDRGCGGGPYREYAFDPLILKELENDLKERFLGIQLHEWSSGTYSDWNLVKEGIGSLPVVFSPDKTTLRYFQMGDKEEYRKRTSPHDIFSFIGDIQYDFKRHFNNFGQRLALTEDCCQSYDVAFRLGAQSAAAELGAQTPMTRIQMAAVRGISRAHRKPWGVYYEPWGGNPFGVACNLQQSSWEIDEKLMRQNAATWCKTGGSSRALQRRLFYYAFLSGASYLSQEWDPENMFSDWESYELTDYGKIVKEVFDFSRTHDRGSIITPVALVFDPGQVPFEVEFLSGKANNIFGYAPSPNQLKLRSFFQALFCNPSSAPKDDECQIMTNSLFPDAFDIISSDAPLYILRQYSMIIYLGKNSRRARQRLGAFSGSWLDFVDIESTALEIYRHLRKSMPVWVEGNIQWMVNRLDDKFLLTIFNNEGITRSVDKGDEYDQSAEAEAQIERNYETGLPEITKPGPDPDIKLAPLSNGKHSITVPPGGVAMVEFPIE